MCAPPLCILVLFPTDVRPIRSAKLLGPASVHARGIAGRSCELTQFGLRHVRLLLWFFFHRNNAEHLVLVATTSFELAKTFRLIGRLTRDTRLDRREEIP